MMGAQASNDQYEKIQSYLKIGKEEGAEVLVGGNINRLEGEFPVVIISSLRYLKVPIK